MGIQPVQWNRRELLTRASLSAAALAAYGADALGDSGLTSETETTPKAEPRIQSLELLSAAPPAAMKAFYHQLLGLPVLEEKADRITIRAGETPITFVNAAPADGKPFYHFAFNIPENKILSARTWQKQRTSLMPIPERLRDPAYPDDVVNYSHWNAHSIFFFDPAGNVVEYIARHDLKNGAQGAFTSRDILYASEIAWIVDDVAASAAKLKEVVGVEQYRGGSDQFMALGDEQGLLLVMKRGRISDFHPSSQEKAARVYRTAAVVRGRHKADYHVPGFPYALTIQGY